MDLISIKEDVAINKQRVVQFPYTGEVVDFLLASIEGLSGENLELENNQACGDCLEYEDDGTPETTYGWNENRVEGQHACACISESGPYLKLSDDNAELQSSLTELRERFKGVVALTKENKSLNTEKVGMIASLCALTKENERLTIEEDEMQVAAQGYYLRAEKAEAHNKELCKALCDAEAVLLMYGANPKYEPLLTIYQALAEKE